MIESVEARFSTFVHPNIWVARSDIPPALERQGGLRPLRQLAGARCC